ncbi:hypothetical protein RA20_01015 [Leisingera sp. ANG-Vp]|nr:hypothetical protein RA20_01015 [Leisingera sp. ANG-Vp]
MARISNARTQALTEVVATVLARSALPEADPEAYITSALRPVQELATSFGNSEDDNILVGKKVDDFAETLEEKALSQLRTLQRERRVQ